MSTEVDSTDIETKNLNELENDDNRDINEFGQDVTADDSSKRKRDEDDEESALTKQQKLVDESNALENSEQTSTLLSSSIKSDSSVPAVAGQITELMEITPDKVGQVIGSKGAIIQEMQNRSGCKIFVNQDFPPGTNRQVSFTGTVAQIKAGKDLVRLIIDDGPTAIHMLNGPVVTQEIDCPQSLVGRIIGSSGATIRELQSRCGAKIQINQDFPDGVPRKIIISGNNDAVQMAVQLINHVMENGPSLQSLPPRGGFSGAGGSIYGAGGFGGPAVGDHSQIPGVTFGAVTTLPNGSLLQIVECLKSYIGRIIGRGGETINLVQSKSGAKVQIDQNVAEGQPCKVTISGSPPSLNLAVQLIQEIMINGPQKIAMFPGIQQQQQQQLQMPMGGGGYFDRNMGPPGGGFGMPGPQFGYAAPSYPGGPGYGQPLAAAMNYGPSMNMGYAAPNLMQQQHHQQQPYAAPVAYGATPSWQQPQHHQQQQPQQQHHQQQQQQQPHQVPVATTYTAPPVKAAPSLPPGWAEHKTDEGVSYWYNSNTGVSQWEKPVA